MGVGSCGLPPWCVMRSWASSVSVLRPRRGPGLREKLRRAGPANRTLRDKGSGAMCQADIDVT